MLEHRTSLLPAAYLRTKHLRKSTSTGRLVRAGSTSVFGCGTYELVSDPASRELDAEKALGRRTVQAELEELKARVGHLE